MLSLDTESSVLQFAIQKCKNYDIQYFNFSCCFVWCETWFLTLGGGRRLRVLENGGLRKLSWPKRDEVSEEWRRLHKDELYDLYSSPNIIWVIKSGRMKWVGRVARVGDGRGAYRVLVGIPVGNRRLGRPSLNGRIILKWDFKKWDGEAWGHVTGGCECGYEPSVP